MKEYKTEKEVNELLAALTGRVNTNLETGIRYGIVQGTSLSHWALEDIFDHGDDLTFAAYKDECIGKVEALLEELDQRHARSRAESIVDTFEWDSYQAEDSDYEYSADGVDLLLTWLGGAPIIFVRKSPVIVVVRRLCTLCAANGGDLDSGLADNPAEGYECYGLPKEWYPGADD